MNFLEDTAPGLELSITRTETPPAAPARQRWIDALGRPFAWSSGTAARGTLEIAGSGVYRIDGDSNRVQAFVRPETDAATIERSFREIVVPLSLLTRGWQVLHASAVSTPDGVIGLCGRSGAGKSTLARAWIERGAAPWSDDSLPVRAIDGRAETIRSSAASSDSGSSASPVAHRLVRLVVLEPEQRAHGSPRFERLAPTEGLRALLPHALCLDPEEPELLRGLFQAYADLAPAVAIDRLRYRQTPEGASSIVRRIEDRIEASRATRV